MSCIGNVLEKFNNIHHSLVFTTEIKNNNVVNDLDITVHETSNLWQCGIFCKFSTINIFTHHPKRQTFWPFYETQKLY